MPSVLPQTHNFEFQARICISKFTKAFVRECINFAAEKISLMGKHQDEEKFKLKETITKYIWSYVRVLCWMFKI